MGKTVMLPKAILEHPSFKGLSDRAKVLFGLLLEKKKEAADNQWIDGKGSEYVILPKKEMMKELECSRYRLDQITKELEACNLIRLEYYRTPTIVRRIYVRKANPESSWIRVGYGNKGELDQKIEDKSSVKCHLNSDHSITENEDNKEINISDVCASMDRIIELLERRKEGEIADFYRAMRNLTAAVLCKEVLESFYEAKGILQG